MLFNTSFLDIEVGPNCYLSNNEAKEHAVKLLISDPQAVAWAWLNAYLENINDQIDQESDYGDTSEITMGELLSTATSHLGNGWGDYIVRGGSFEGYSVEPLFWDKLALVLDIEIPEDKRSGFFSCSC